VVVPSKAGNRVALEVVWVDADTRDNKTCGLVGLVLHPALVFSLVVFEEALLAEVEVSVVAFAAIEVEALAIGEASVAIEEVVMVIEGVTEVEAALDIKELVDSEAVAGMRMVLLRPMRPVDQVVPVVGMVVNQTVALHRTTAIVAAMATLIGMDTVQPARLELHDRTAVTNEGASPEAIGNQSSLATEATVEIEIVTATATENGNGEAIGTGMAAADDGTMTLAREKDTMKVMAMMTREANEGIKSNSLHQSVRPQQQRHSSNGDNNVTIDFFGGYPRCSSPLLALSFSTQYNSTVCRWVPTCSSSSSPHL
jgi:hypothetical protein